MTTPDPPVDPIPEPPAGPPGSADVVLPIPLSQLEIAAPPLPPDPTPPPPAAADVPMIALSEEAPDA
ncbi:hypothetical protein [Kitasatospora cineracea]|uniref:Uncharacterized protein n=1 Tax=Kitasatospora cineracea TaxID=88074 RepID=A0A3N4R247_9ACTN|nr:hypothetical protein [Kitasatospora cineracea]RPE27272.1 hypothetical protein EDD38_7417 [Kitasatospora cineracea]